MPSLLYQQSKNVPSHHIFRIDPYKTTSLSVYYYTLLLALPFPHRDCTYLSMAHFFESLTLSAYKKMHYINTLIQFYGVNHTHPLKPYHQHRYDNNLVASLYYKNERNTVISVGEKKDTNHDVWLSTTLEQLPDHIMVPHVNLLKVDEKFWAWTESTPMSEQIALWDFLHTMNIDYVDYIHAQSSDEFILWM